MPPSVVSTGNRLIGPGQPCYLIVEVGTTCLGDIEKALRLVEASAAAGVDAVKFQVIDPSQLSDRSVVFQYRSGGKTYSANMAEMFERLTFDERDWTRIASACRAAGLDFFATIDYLSGVDMMERIGVVAHKLGAWDCTYRPLVERMAATGRPVFCDLGPTTEEEMSSLIAWFRAARGSALLLMHDFHTTDDSEMNLRAISFLNEVTEWPAGFSSPGRDDDLDMAALALGAHHLEKRLILSRTEHAFHADESLEPRELADWVRRVRHVERTLGQGGIRPSREDRRQARDYYRSICTLRDVGAGEVFSPENIGGKRPGTGMQTAQIDAIWGRRAARALARDVLLTEADIL